MEFDDEEHTIFDVTPGTWRQRVWFDDDAMRFRCLESDASVLRPILQIVGHPFQGSDPQEDEGDLTIRDLTCSLMLRPASEETSLSSENRIEAPNRDRGFLELKKGYRGDEDIDEELPSLRCRMRVDDSDFEILWNRVSSQHRGHIKIHLVVSGSMIESGMWSGKWRIDEGHVAQVVSYGLELSFAEAPQSAEVQNLRSHRLGGQSIESRAKRLLAQYQLAYPNDRDERWQRSQFNHLTREIIGTIKHYSMSQSESESDFEDRVHEAMDIVSSIRWAANKDTARKVSFDEEETAEQQEARKQAEHTIWTHGNLTWALREGYDSEYAEKVDVDFLSQTTMEYLQRPWMENQRLEWIIVDALVYGTLEAYGEALKKAVPGNDDFIGMNMTYYKAKGNLQEMTTIRAKQELRRLGTTIAVFLGIPILTAWYFWEEGRKEDVVVFGIAYASLFLLVVLIRWISKLARGNEDNSAIEQGKRLDQGYGIYGLLEEGVKSPSLIRHLMFDVAGKGLIWPGAAIAILDNAIRRDPARWAIPEKR